jgi:hypothetical protein
MRQNGKAKVDRRDLLRALGASGGVVGAPGGVLVSEAQANSEYSDENREARYRAVFADVKAFYRVSNYPK